MIHIADEKLLVKTIDADDADKKKLWIEQQVYIHFAKKREPVFELANSLALRKVPDLRKMGKIYQIPDYYRMNKATIISALTEKMAEADRLKGYLEILETPVWEIFKKVVKVKWLTDEWIAFNNFFTLYLLGMINVYYHRDHVYYVVPSEIKAIYQKLEESGFPEEKEYADLLDAYAVAATNLYGVISQDDFVELFNSQNDRKTDIDEMFDVLIRFVSLDSGYCFWEDYLVNDEFEENDFEDVGFTAEAAARKPRYLPEREEFLKYSDWSYIEKSPQFDKLKYYIHRTLTDDDDLAEELLEEIYFMTMREARTQEYADIFEKYNINLSVDKIKLLMSLIFDLSNNTRKWLNNGHTPMELLVNEGKSPQLSSNIPIRVIRIGRNDPCPCGSGKKYKNCCGR